MSIRRINCPGCSTVVNVPAAMANVKCPKCGMVWNVNNPPAAKPTAAAKAGTKPESAKANSSSGGGSAAMIAGIIGGVMMLLAIIGVGLVVMNREPPPAPAAEAVVEVEETIKPAEPQEFRVVNLPEPKRKEIYNQYRQVARTTVEAPLGIPQGGVRKNLEGMLDATFERELRRFAALHDITVDDVKEIIKEGDAKVWDDSPRSNATRDGKRVYPKEMSEGWEKNQNRL